MLSKRFKHTASSGIDITDATATADDVRTGKTAYIASGKIDGELTPLDTSDATAAEGDILTGKTAYVDGSKITGSASPNPFPPFETLIPLSNLTVSFSHTIA